MRRQLQTLRLLAAITPLLCLAASASDWPCSGGNPLRNAQSAEIGPSAQALLWSSSIPTRIDNQVFTEGNRVYAANADGMRIECLDLSTGAERWNVLVPTTAGSDNAWVAGVSQGRLYVSRSCGLSCSSPFYCFDSTSGALLWQTAELIEARSTAGVVFAPNGDPVIGNPASIRRIDHLTGTTVWLAIRQFIATFHCGVAMRGQSVYSVDRLDTYFCIVRRDLATGVALYHSPQLITGASASNTPMIGPDGTIYMAVNSNPTRLFLAWTDTGTGFVLKWSVPVGPNYDAEFGIGPDGSVYLPTPGAVPQISRLDPSTGTQINTSAPFYYDSVESTHFAIDALGKVYLMSSAQLFSFNSDLSLRWSVPLNGTVLHSGPALAQDGTLLIAGHNVFAWRDPPISTGICAGDGSGPVACPCGNSGSSGHGCANSVYASGGHLEAAGVASVSSDSVVLRSSGMPDSPVIYLQATSATAGGQGLALGDGLRCVSGSVLRIGTALNVGGASHYPEVGDLPVSVRGQIPAAGAVRTYQAWYRNAAPYCTSATFNLTNGASIAWVP